MIHPDFRDLLSAFAAEQVEYLVIGGYAVGFHARPRSTKDIDLFVGNAPANLARVHTALAVFGAPEPILEAIRSTGEEDIVWFGVPPTRVDILRHVDGISFEDAYARRVLAEWEGVPVSIVALDDLIATKQAAGREQDLRDIRSLQRSRGG